MRYYFQAPSLIGKASILLEAFLQSDILPLRPGHTLVIPKTHISRVSELPAEFAAATGEAISKVANALTKGVHLVFNRKKRINTLYSLF